MIFSSLFWKRNFLLASSVIFQRHVLNFGENYSQDSSDVEWTMQFKGIYFFIIFIKFTSKFYRIFCWKWCYLVDSDYPSLTYWPYFGRNAICRVLLRLSVIKSLDYSRIIRIECYSNILVYNFVGNHVDFDGCLLKQLL